MDLGLAGCFFFVGFLGGRGIEVAGFFGFADGAPLLAVVFAALAVFFFICFELLFDGFLFFFGLGLFELFFLGFAFLFIGFGVEGFIDGAVDAAVDARIYFADALVYFGVNTLVCFGDDAVADFIEAVADALSGGAGGGGEE